MTSSDGIEGFQLHQSGTALPLSQIWYLIQLAYQGISSQSPPKHETDIVAKATELATVLHVSDSIQLSNVLIGATSQSILFCTINIETRFHFEGSLLESILFSRLFPEIAGTPICSAQPAYEQPITHDLRPMFSI